MRSTAGRADTRGRGGYVVAPPSRRPDDAYRWRTVPGRLATIPAWVFDLLEAKPVPAAPFVIRGDAGRALVGLLDAVLSPPGGQRHDRRYLSEASMAQLTPPAATALEPRREDINHDPQEVIDTAAVKTA